MDAAPDAAIRRAAGRQARGPRPDQLPTEINPERRGDFQFELPNLFPNFLIHLASGCGYRGWRSD
jgi:hypothetical protein